jgi:DNA-directed RNA polymerase specialized sigma24 family protein
MNSGEPIIAQPTLNFSLRSRAELERAYEQLWVEHGASLARLAWSYERDPQAQEDLLQEIRLAIWTALPDPRSSPELSVISRADELRLIETIRLLPIPFRQVLTLALEDLSHAEIALVLGISENNVAVRMNRARKLLKERLGRP